MPLFMDIHKNVGAGIDEVKAAHERDLETQTEYGVDYKKYWVDEENGTIFYLFEGPNKEAGERVHAEAHGLTADEIYEVVEG